MKRFTVWLLAATIAGCSNSKTTSDSQPPVAAEPQATTPAPAESLTFVDRVWRVEESATVERGQTYTFRSDGTLHIESPHGTPAEGTWVRSGDGLTVTEDGIAYPVDIVSLTATGFQIRYHDPGGNTTDIRMAPADSPTK
jgi:hypothetical protein